MITYNIQPNTPEWHAHRNSGLCNASEAPAMLGLSAYTTRQELLRRKATGYKADVDSATQARFDDGHAAEAAARPNVEAIVDDTLPPAIVSDDDKFLGASLDGMTFTGDLIWEHKLENQKLIDYIFEHRDLPDTHWPQVEQQLHITGASQCLFTVGTKSGIILSRLFYTSEPQRIAMVIAGWQQFVADLANYVPEVTQAAPVVIGRAPELLPALNIRLTGMVTASNLNEFHAHAMAVFDGINTDLQTDEDFADAEKTAKWCKDVEGRLEAAKESALAQTADIDAVFKLIDSIKEEAKQKRLFLEKTVKARKESIREEIYFAGINELNKYIDQVNDELDLKIINVVHDFSGAMKSKRTIQSLRDAVAGELASMKIQVNKQKELIVKNLAILSEFTADYKFLFNDANTLVLKESDSLTAICKTRIADFKEQEAAKASIEAAKPLQQVADNAPIPRVNQIKMPAVSDLLGVIENHYCVDQAIAKQWIIDAANKMQRV